MATMMTRLFAAIQPWLPQRLLSAVVHRVMRWRWVPWKNTVIRVMSKLYSIDVAEAASSNPADYEHFNAFFTRQLREGARPMDADDNAIACPADGAVCATGLMDDDTRFIAKHHEFDLSTLLGDAELAERYRGGRFATVYLSPRDYHRVHMPLTGTLRDCVHVPGRLFSVSTGSVANIPALFARNERVVCDFDTEYGPMALVLVGAMLVSSIETVWDGMITPPYAKQVRRWRPENASTVQRGEEMGRFNMGSTVIMLLGNNAVRWHEGFTEAAPCRLRESVGQIAR
jgi:phosphatidylserine decarboxylase